MTITFLLQITREIAEYLSPKYVEKVQLLLQVNKEEHDAVNYYRQRGFQFFSSSKKNSIKHIIDSLSDSFGNKNKGGQFIHYLKHKYMLFAVNDNIILSDRSDKIPAINLQHFLLSSPDIGYQKSRSRRNRQHSEEDKAGIANQYSNEISMCAYAKVSIYIKKIDAYAGSLLTKSQLENFRACINYFPPSTKFSYADYEGFCSNMDCYGNSMDDQGFFKAILRKLWLTYVYRNVDKVFYVGSENYKYYSEYQRSFTSQASYG